jgi:membrane fusion protein (multidrug efflux system)
VAAHSQARADVAAARAAVDAAQINLGYTRVTAPVSGHIGKSSVTPGALVTANQAMSLARIQKLDPMYVDVTQSSADILRLRRSFAEGKLVKSGESGAEVRLLLEDGSEYPIRGGMEFSDVSVDPGTGMVTVRATFRNPDGILFPGMYVRAVMEEAVNEKGILVPQQAVSRDTQGRPTAMVLNRDGRVELRILTVDRSVNMKTVDPGQEGNVWLVSSGLAEGEQLIVEGLLRVQAGAVARGVPVAPTGVKQHGNGNGAGPGHAASAGG